MSIIEQIKAEIERRISDNTFGAKLELIDILAWLDTLESEKPIEGLEEELDKWRHEHFHGKRDDHFSGEYLERTSQLELARHFAQWGAEHLADARKTSPKDIEEAADEYEKKHTYQRYDGGGLTPEYNATLAEAFIAGYNLCKEQMMKEAVEGVFQNTPFPTICLDDCKDYDFKDGDKAHIIVIPNTDEK